jgi:general stress protein 26
MSVPFAEIEAEFVARVNRIVWCTVATVDGAGRPRSRILHPIWEGQVGWIATGRHSPKAAHLTRNPYVSLTYWDPRHEQVHADCRAEWADDVPTKRRVWNLFRDAPPPMGYDPGAFFPGGPEDREFGALRLVPWRISLWSLADLIGGKPPQVWRP